MQHFKLSFLTFLMGLGIHFFAFSQEAKPLSPETLPLEALTDEINPKIVTQYPRAMMSRPFTLPSNSVETSMKLKFGSHEGSKAFYSLESLSLDYGVTDDLQLGLSWGGMSVDDISFKNFEASPSLSLNAGYFLFAIPHVAAMASLSLPFHFDKEVVKTTSLAMPTAFGLINGKLSIMAFYADLVKIYWREDTANKKGQYTLDFNFPIKLAYQATDTLYTALSTHVGTLSTDGVHSHVLKKTPLHLEMLYALDSEWDISAKLGFDDVQKWKDTFSFIAGVSYRFGSISG